MSWFFFHFPFYIKLFLFTKFKAFMLLNVMLRFNYKSSDVKLFFTAFSLSVFILVFVFSLSSFWLNAIDWLMDWFVGWLVGRYHSTYVNLTLLWYILFLLSKGNEHCSFTFLSSLCLSESDHQLFGTFTTLMDNRPWSDFMTFKCVYTICLDSFILNPGNSSSTVCKSI